MKQTTQSVTERKGFSLRFVRVPFISPPIHAVAVGIVFFLKLIFVWKYIKIIFFLFLKFVFNINALKIKMIYFKKCLIFFNGFLFAVAVKRHDVVFEEDTLNLKHPF